MDGFLSKAVGAINQASGSSNRNSDHHNEGRNDNAFGYTQSGQSSQGDRYGETRPDSYGRNDNNGSNAGPKQSDLGGAAKDFVGTLFGGGEAKKREEEERRRQEEERRRQEEAAKNPVEKLIGGFLGGNKTQTQQKQEGGFMGKIGNKFEESLGGGQKAEQKEDALDKAIDAFQEHVLKQGPQHNESVLEHKKDEQIANFIRGATGINKK